jgi:hypothetical protein
MKKNCETKGSNREPDEWWFPTLTTTPQIDSCLLHAFILFCTVLASSIWKFIQRPKNTSKTGFKPMITGTYRPHPNHYTTCPVLVLTCLIFSLYVNWCFLRPFNLAQKRGDSGGIRTRDTRPHIRAPYHRTTYVIWFWIPCFFFIASITARLVTRTPRGKFGKKLRQKGGVRTLVSRTRLGRLTTTVLVELWINLVF